MTMADYEQIMKALRNAHAAGDQFAAKRLAAMAKAAKDTLSPPAQNPMQERIAAAKAAVRSGELASSSPEQQVIDRGVEQDIRDPGGLAALGIGAVQGATFNFGDEILGRVASMSPNVTYDDAVSRLRAQEGNARFARPKTVLAGEVSGGIAASIPGAAVAGPAIASKAGATLGARALQGIAGGAVAGAAGGAISGAGAGTEGNRMSSALSGAGVGALFGGAVGGVAPVVAQGASSFIKWLKGSDVAAIVNELGVSKEAARVIKNAIQNDDLGAAQAALDRAGPGGMLADAGPGTRALLDASISTGGKAGRIAGEAIEDRAAASGRAMEGVMNKTLGVPASRDELISGVRTGSAAARKEAYDAAFDVEIDWNSPAGEDLRKLLQTTPKDVLQRAARNSSMARRGGDIPEAAYPEFAPVVTSGQGAARDAAEAGDIAAYFADFNKAEPRLAKRPLTYAISRMGGIDPKSPAAADLYALGVNPKTTPGLFRRGGLPDLDNLDPSLLPEQMQNSLDGTGNYVDRQFLIDGLRSEIEGTPIRSASDDALAAQRAQLHAMLPEYEARRAALLGRQTQAAAMPTAPDVVGDTVPMKTVRDIDQIKRALDEIERTNDGLGKLGGQTEYGMEAGKRARELRDALKEASPDYGRALETASDSIRQVEGVKFGSTLLKSGTHRADVSQFIKRSTGPERQAAKAGVRSYIDDTLANVRGYITSPNMEINEFRRLVSELSSRASRDKMRMILGPEESLEFFKTLDREVMSLELRAAVAANSKTAVRGAIQRGVSDQTAPGALGVLMEGEPVNASKRIIQALTGKTPEARALREQGIFDEIAKALTEKRGGEAKVALAIIDRARKGQPVTDAQASLIGRALGGATALGGYQTGTKYLEYRKNALSPQ